MLVASSRRNSGVNVSRASPTGAKAVTIRDTGAVTLLASPLSSHWVRIDIESLPTGMVIPSSGQKSSPTALTVSYNTASSPRYPAAHIQFADNLISCKDKTGAANKLVMASATAKRADAGPFSVATGVLSPILIASPKCVSSPAVVTATSATGTCQGPTI